MSPVVDNHVHVHPPLGTFGPVAALDHCDAERQQRFVQRQIYLWGRTAGATSRQIIRRVDDERPVPEAWQVLWDPALWGKWHGLQPAGLRVADGMAVWQHDGHEVSLDLRRLTYRACPPQLLMKLMDEVGVDVCVIQGGYYLQRYIADLVKAHPGRFIGHIHIEWGELPMAEQVEELQHAHRQLGLKALRFSAYDFWPGYYDFHEPHFEPVWQYVERHGIVTTIGGGYDNRDAPFEVFLPRLKILLDRHPQLKLVIEHGLPYRFFLPDNDTTPAMKQLAVELLNNHDICMEAIPYHGVRIRNLCPVLPQVIEQTGIEKIVWGSEMLVFQPPDDESPEHYRKSRQFFELHCPYLSAAERDLILGGNLARMHGLAAEGGDKKAALS